MFKFNISLAWCLLVVLFMALWNINQMCIVSRENVPSHQWHVNIGNSVNHPEQQEVFPDTIHITLLK